MIQQKNIAVDELKGWQSLPLKEIFGYKYFILWHGRKFLVKYKRLGQFQYTDVPVKARNWQEAYRAVENFLLDQR